MNQPQVQVSIVKVAKQVPPPKAQAKVEGPKWNNQKVVRSEGRSEGYVYNDWRNW